MADLLEIKCNLCRPLLLVTGRQMARMDDDAKCKGRGARMGEDAPEGLRPRRLLKVAPMDRPDLAPGCASERTLAGQKQICYKRVNPTSALLEWHFNQLWGYERTSPTN
jgi:hypothetical protein